MITLITCLLLIAALLFIYAVLGVQKAEKRSRAWMRLSAAIADDNAQKYDDAQAAELNNTRWDGD